MTLRIVFAGTGQFAVPCLQALAQSKHAVVAVYTRPDRQAGRGRRVIHSPVKQLAMAQGLEIRQPATLDGELDFLRAAAADVIVVVSFGLILPAAVLAIPRYGCINVHASLLPRWRGAAPIVRAIEAGDSITGVTVMQMDEGLDTGDILLQSQQAIQRADNAGTLRERLAACAATALMSALAALPKGQLDRRHQDNREASYAHKVRKQESELEWNCGAAELALKVRAFNPWPVATTHHGKTRLRVWGAKPVDSTAHQPFGTIVGSNNNGILVQTGAGGLLLTCVQRPGGKVLAARDFLNGYALSIGDRLGSILC
ncbi:MAG: methionyl-tRNA formyltransferase [Gammaproteobacteria bacterium]|nr:methionyl-tRNA formyltransferase [Gammaproteobacteria bacterium]